MNFGDILKQFEDSQRINKKAVHDIILGYIDKYGVLDKDKNIEEYHNDKIVNYRKTKIDDILDLHGATKKEALEKLQIFFDNAIKFRYKKVSIIHGKGKHSKKQAVLYDVVRNFLEENKHAGKIGFEKGNNGGRGVTWVMLKYH